MKSHSPALTQDGPEETRAPINQMIIRLIQENGRDSNEPGLLESFRTNIWAK